MKHLQPCQIPGCPNLVNTGYCKDHQQYSTVNKGRDRFKNLDKKKTSEEKKFYSKSAWTKSSRLYRREHPICERCEKKNIIVKAQLVHHKKKLRDILKDKGNPLSFKYLESLCNKCHLRELYSYKKSKNNKYLY